jgi:hypothetical protein
MESVLHTLEHSGARYSDMALVIAREWRVTDAFWRDFADEVEKSNAAEADELFAALVEVCRRFVLSGPQIEHRPKVLGRLIEENRAITLIRTATRLDWPMAQSMLEDMMLSNLGAIKRVASTIPLGAHAMWSTFSETEPEGKDPFRPYDDVTLLPIELGLDVDPRIHATRKFVVFAYTLPPSMAPRWPTIADAYAGGFPNARFRPFGKTHPTVLDLEHARSRPECVHGVVTMNHLTARPGGIPEPGWPR